MFNEGTRALLDNLPRLAGLDADVVRRLLTASYLDVVAARELDVEATRRHEPDLRHVATALELHAVFAPDLQVTTLRACAFVAAEALEVVRELSAETEEPPEYVAGLLEPAFIAAEAGALYLIAGYDANAAVASRMVLGSGNPTGSIAPALERVMQSIAAFLTLRRPPEADPPDAPDDLRPRLKVRWAAWHEMAQLLDRHTRWLRLEDPEASPAAEELMALAARLVPAGESTLGQASQYSAPSHLAELFGHAASETTARALRAVPANDGATIWDRYVTRRSQERPLIWPPAQAYADSALPGPSAHAVVTVPTGAGKSAVAELAIAQSLQDGWVLYLAPTNALVAQIMRDLRRLFGPDDAIRVRAFVGGAEYTELAGEAVQEVGDAQILVMTPEKCSLALRQQPDAFERLALLVFDECHLLGDKGSRGVISELVISEILHRARSAHVLMLSAMVGNPDELASWLVHATEQRVITVNDSWRPTRTVRALLGVDPGRADPAYQDAAEELESRANRVNWGFDAPVNLLASLQGAWRGADPDDYLVINTGLTVRLNARKNDEGNISVDRTGYLNPAAGELTHRLATSGERVLTFLPANKHHSFSVARDLDPLQPRPRQNARLNAIDALLLLARDELGVETPLRELLGRGVGVHTSAMLVEEQRASELAFVDGQARALFATGTLAQGLNLPATSVVVGGTRIGHDPTLSADELAERERSQLLNAVGRAGRAYVSERSVAVVIPNRWVVIAEGQSPAGPRESAPFLEFEDASTTIRSQVEGLIARDFDEPPIVDALTSEEQTAFSFLALGEDEINRATVQRSFGAYRAGVSTEQAERIADGLRAAGESFVRSAGVPNWLGEAAHAAGLPLPVVFALYNSATAALQEEGLSDMSSCRSLLVRALGTFNRDVSRLAISRDAFEGTRIEDLLESDSRAARTEALSSLASLLEAWMAGRTYTELAGIALGPDAQGNDGRGSGNPLPKIIGAIDHGVRFGLSGTAGALAAIASVGEVHGDDTWALPEEEKLQLDTFPLALRLGCEDVHTTAWCRWGFRNRRVARVLAEALPPPADLPADQLATWVRRRRRELDPDELPPNLDDNRELITAAVIAGRVL